MASVAFSEDTAPYYTVVVSFDGRSFEQLLVSPLVGADLAAMLDEYANIYEQEWHALGTPEPVEEVDAREGYRVPTAELGATPTEQDVVTF